MNLTMSSIRVQEVATNGTFNRSYLPSKPLKRVKKVSSRRIVKRGLKGLIIDVMA